MNYNLKILDVVALLKEFPARGLQKGQVGTIVEFLEHGVYEVEFSDKEGRAISILAIKEKDLLLLHYDQKSA